ncbi:MAG TPA: helix-turn-helix transcriptional regulator [Mycobacteriales bacterium]|jgi:transcriptional regulator with XRE-family HTH domain|nr:helix-turn-helix transcriptional regulator [Mycobacteriales bacterium]
MSQPSPGAEPTLGARLRELRGESSSTQGTLAAALGLATSSISAYEKDTLRPTDTRLRDIATYVVLARDPDGTRREELPPEGQLTEEQRAERDGLLDELRRLRVRTQEQADETGGRRDLWAFEPGESVMLVCGNLEGTEHPYSDPGDPNYTALLSYADLDAFVELHGHIRMRNPQAEVRFTQPDKLKADDLTSHLVMIGGPGLNKTLQQVFARTRLPIRQDKHPEFKNGEVFYVEKQDEPHLPVFDRSDPPQLTEDIGLLARLTNPFNAASTLTWCSGVYSRGVFGAVRLTTDAKLRDSNMDYLTDRGSQFAVLVKVPVVSGSAMTPDLQNPDSRLRIWSDDEDSDATGTGT